LRVRNLSFSYGKSNAQILRDISFDLPAGASVGIVGPSGSGKSTLLRILLGLESLSGRGQGNIFIDGRDLSASESERLAAFSPVLQETDLFRGLSLLGNVCYGSSTMPSSSSAVAAQHDPSSNDSLQAQSEILLPVASPHSYSEDVDTTGAFTDMDAPIASRADAGALQRAAADAQLYPILHKRTEEGGWLSDVGPLGRALSGGERQRVCMARCFYRQECTGGVMLIDEGTSSLDPHAESLVTAAVRQRVAGGGEKGGAVIVAHRLTCVRDCDEILVLRDGLLQDQGSHSQVAQSH
jgi:ABC-type multidrug transport system fused ATPase/permease subunit